MILDKEVEINLNPSNIKHYMTLDYDCLNKKTLIVKQCDLTYSSKTKVTVICDVCNKEKLIPYFYYSRNIKNGGFYACCHKCANIKRDITCEKIYGVKNVFQNKEIKDISKQTKYDRYGNENYNNREKSITTCLEKYGVAYNTQTYDMKEKSKQTRYERYGDENYNNMPKYFETCLQRYGVKNVNKLPEIKEKIKITNLEKYGFYNPTKSKIVRDKLDKNFILKYNTHNILKIEGDICTIQCDKNHSFEINKINLYNRQKLKTIICTICNPIDQFISGVEIDFKNFVKKNYSGEILESDRNLIKPYELDVYLPNLKVAFEFNGLFWHSDKYKDNNYHSMKSDLCDEKDILLIHIWEDDWMNKNEILKKYILSILNDKYDFLDLSINGDIMSRSYPLKLEKIGYKIREILPPKCNYIKNGKRTNEISNFKFYDAGDFLIEKINERY